MTARKYKNKPTIVDGVRFDSGAEAKRWAELKLLERAGEIRNLERQVPFKIEMNGVKICTYIADFVFFDGSQRRVIEDKKGFATKEFKLKAKLMKAFFNIEVRVT